MVVVEQPFGGGRDRTALVGGLGDAAIGSLQHARSLSARRSTSELPIAGPGGNGLVRREAFGMLFQPFDAEKLAADGVFVIP